MMADRRRIRAMAAPRIEPRFIPPTITAGSGLTRDYVDGRIEGLPDSFYNDAKGRYWFALLAGFAVLGTIAAAAVGG